MHEFSIAQSLLDSALKAAEEQKAEKVLEVDVEVGRILSIPASQLKFAFGVCARGTRAEGATLHVRTIPPRIRCHNCGFQGTLRLRVTHSHDEPLYLKCPRCGSTETGVLGGESCEIKGIRIRVKSEKNK